MSPKFAHCHFLPRFEELGCGGQGGAGVLDLDCQEQRPEVPMTPGGPCLPVTVSVQRHVLWALTVRGDSSDLVPPAPQGSRPHWPPQPQAHRTLDHLPVGLIGCQRESPGRAGPGTGPVSSKHTRQLSLKDRPPVSGPVPSARNSLALSVLTEANRSEDPVSR